MTRTVRIFLLLLAMLFGAVSDVSANARTQVRLLLDKTAAKPGETVLAGIELTMPPNWHTYWINPGASGDATRVEWTLPNGFKAGPLEYPLPEKHDFEGLWTYVYHGRVTLIVPIEIPANQPAGKVDVRGKVTWLECEKSCIPGDAAVEAQLTIGNESVPSPAAAQITESRQKVPKLDTDPKLTAYWEKPVAPGDESRHLLLEWTSADIKDPEFYPHPGDGYEIAPETQIVPGTAGKVVLKKEVKKFKGEWPTKVSGVLLTSAETGSEIRDVPIATKAATSTSASGLARMLLLAFLGGLILNIMPCVLPVIALKILGFVQQSQESPARVRKLGLVYGLGVLFSFVILAGIVIAVQRAGNVASWGMQMQNPYFLLVMLVVVTLVSLNLFGLFEINLGGKAMGAAGQLASKEGSAGAFFNGMFATILATPCTAPFLGVALGFAFLQPPTIILLMFLTVGFGLALPYIILSWHPAFIRLLPKPGPWMERFKVAMGFPMLATAIWIFSLTLVHFGKNSAVWIGLFLVTVALAVWIWGEFVQRGTRRPALAALIALLSLGLGYGMILERQLDWRHLGAERDEIKWEPWSPEAVAAARAQGRPVLVDFTADWCLVCKWNEERSVDIPRVREKLKKINAVTLIGDFTLKNDTRIAMELKKWERAGVPLVLVYPADKNAPPLLLPEKLSPSIVLDALEKAKASPQNVAAGQKEND